NRRRGYAMSAETPRPPPGEQGTAVVDGITLHPSPTTTPGPAQPPPKRKGGGSKRTVSKSDAPSAEDARGPYSAARLRRMDGRFRLAMRNAGHGLMARAGRAAS